MVNISEKKFNSQIDKTLTNILGIVMISMPVNHAYKAYKSSLGKNCITYIPILTSSSLEMHVKCCC